ncbi:HaeIII family restriction endonuclease [Undibacterium sp. RTI2.1]|uniref:HaeIII family restriction endonuclease n=1 Tax=unclassified Undibacterium TaxID=2630295 RepID=UPI002B229BC8|nr:MULTISPECIES: HaeIII family restriction endonuclease [unclassified Undibacterium]MEB0032686.1 HaeIII family restriction endonuclease [Undibacterium sp. RTI2.1]MEB0118673.1 HaeIII family restriction endonuclease [Undibacterium sp. RTI2.2]
MTESNNEKGNHVRNGKAFEWAVACALKDISSYEIIEDKHTLKPREYFSELQLSDQQSFYKSAERGVRHIVQKEAKFFSSGVGAIRFQSDSAGQSGDVRDLIISNGTNEIGFSCKNNHSDLKHSRLSDVLDFAKEWGLNESGCSESYWHEIHNAFSGIKQIVANEVNPTWRELPNKEQVYWNVLNAWASEILRCYGETQEQNALLCERLINYLFGSHDFYKIMRRDQSSVDIQCVNFRRKLTRPYAKFPTVIRAIDNLNGTQYSKTIAFNNGFSINFRIHNADSKLNTSLKFGIKALSLPSDQFYQQTLDVA